MSFGKRVKQARSDQNLTLQELSVRSGVSRSMLSKIEREEKNPTIQIACQVAEGLSMTLSQLLGEQEEREVMLIKKHQRMMYRDEQSGFERQLLTPVLPTRGIEFLFNTLPAQQETGTFPPHKQGVTECLVVAQGQLQVWLGECVYLLEEGDSLFYDANIPHRIVNLGDTPGEYYVVIDSHHAKL